MDKNDFLSKLAEIFGQRPLSEDFGINTDIGQMLSAVGVLFITILAARLAVVMLRRFRSGQEDDRDRGTKPRVGDRFLMAALFVVGTLIALQVLGIEVQEAIGYTLFKIGEKPVTVSTVLIALACFVGAMIVSRLVQTDMGRTIQAPTPQAKANVRTLGRLLHYAILIVGIALALQQMHVDLTALVAVGGVLAIAIGFAMQKIVENFVSGVILLVERSIRPGDVLEVEGRVVEVITMGIRSTVVRTRDGEELVVPNSILVSNTVKNYTLRDSLYRLRGKVGVAYTSDMKLVFEVLQKTADEFEHGLKNPRPQVQLTEFGSSSVDFDVCVWMQDPWQGNQAKSDLNEAIWFALQQAGIVIAFPQLDLHLDAEAYAALAGRSAAPDSVLPEDQDSGDDDAD